jgi:hypothetical protein
MRLNASMTVMLGTLCLSATLHAQADNRPLYRTVQTVKLGEPERWDYVVVDPRTHRVYIAHGTKLTVVDGTRGTVVGEVTGFPGGTHGTAVASELGRGYTDDGRAGEAGGFDLATLAPRAHLKVAEDADAMV